VGIRNNKKRFVAVFEKFDIFFIKSIMAFARAISPLSLETNLENLSKEVK